MEIIISIVALVVSVLSVGLAVFTFHWTAARDRKQATLEAYNRLQKEVFDELNLYSPAEIQEICTDNRSEDYKVISDYLARIEHFCVGINQKIYDEETFYALAHGYFDGYQLKKRIEPILYRKNSGSGSQELFYNDTLAVLQWMEKKEAKK